MPPDRRRPQLMLAPSGSFSTTPQALEDYGSYDPEDANSWVTPVTFYNPYPIESVDELTLEQADAKLMEAVPACGNALTMGEARCQELAEALRGGQPVFAATGGAHAAGVFSGAGEFLATAEDIGRHNALDKAIGACLLADRATTGCGVVLSGRVSFEMVAKAARAGLEIIVAVSGPTSLAVAAADHWNITLCGFVRGDRMNVYTHPSRVEELANT